MTEVRYLKAVAQAGRGSIRRVRKEHADVLLRLGIVEIVQKEPVPSDKPKGKPKATKKEA